MIMKCKDCTINCHYRKSDGERQCEFQDRIIQLPDEWQYVRIQAAIACLAQIVGNIPSDIQGDYTESYVEEAINYADELVKQLKEK